MSAGSIQIENGRWFIVDVKSLKWKAARTLFNMDVTFVEAKWYFKAVC